MMGFLAERLKPVPEQDNDDVSSALFVVAADTLSKQHPSEKQKEVVLDFGETSVLDHSEVTAVFTIRNRRTRAVCVDRIETSCGCTRVTLRAQNRAKSVILQTDSAGEIAAEEVPYLLPAGGTASVEVVLDLMVRLPEAVSKRVRVYADGAAQPAVTAELKGRIRRSVTFAARSLDFGQVPVGQCRAATIEATFDARLLRNENVLSSEPPQVVSPSSFFSVTGHWCAPLRSADEAVATLQESSERTAAYDVTLASDAPIGINQALLRFADAVSSIDAPSAHSPAVAAWRQGVLFVRAEVTGDATADPAVLFGPPISSGAGNMWHVTLTASDSATLRITGVEVDGDYLAVSLGSLVTLDSGAKRSLQIILSAEAPSGYYDRSVLIYLGNGQRMILPLRASVLTTKL